MTTIPLTGEFTLSRSHQSDRKTPVRWLFSRTKRYWYLVVLLFIGAISNAALAAVIPVMVGRAFNAINQPQPDGSALLPIALFIIITQIVRGLLQFARNFSAELLGQRLERDTRDELFVSLLGKSMTFHSLQPLGDTMARATNDVREINFMFSPGFNLVVGSAIFMIVPLVIAPRYSPSLVIVPALFIIGYFLSLWQYLHELDPITGEVRRSFGRMNTRLAEAIDGIETVKGMAQERQEVERFGLNAKSFRNAYVKQGDVEARFVPLLLLGLAEAGALFQSLILYRQGQLDLGQVIAFFGLIQLFGFPTFTSLFAYSQVALGISSSKRILDLINRENQMDQNETGYRGPMRGEVEFRNVTFRYENSLEPALEDVSFKVIPGQTVAIVGQTGVGKTSLVKLINRTYDVSSGQILVDGVDVRDWNLEMLRRGISIIEQDIFLFSRTISENIAFGMPDAAQDAIESASLAAQAHEFVSTFQDHYQTVIGERGVTLSGGQRQRLALARAFLTAPAVLVLDDSTSAIDSETEDRIQRAIFAAARGRTTFIITHRLSQIRWADLVLALRHGKLVATGKHEDLLRTSEPYQRIFR